MRGHDVGDGLAGEERGAFMNWTLAGGGTDKKEEQGGCDRKVTGRTKAPAGA